MDLRHYFKPATSTSLPCPKGPLSAILKEGAIAAANKAISEVLQTPESKRRGSYSKFTPEQQAEIGRYAALNGNKAAVRHFSKSLSKGIKESSVSTWKKKYISETKRIQGERGKDAPTIKSLPVKKRGRPLLLGTSMDDEVKSYIRAVREAGGVITSSITIAAATAIVRQSDRNLLRENGGPIALSKNWAKSLLYRLNFVKRKGSTSHKVSVQNFEELKKQFLLDIRAVRDMEDIPPELIFNWDHTGISIVPGSSWTMELKGSKRVEIVGIDDKRQITAVFCGTLAGEFLPLQLIYQGKTKASLPPHNFPDDWHVTFTPNHWSNEDTTKEYIKKIILPYVQSKRKELHLPDDFPALAIYDVFKGQMTQEVFDLLEKNHIYTVRVPANLTDRLQPMDLSVNKPAKGFMRDKFQEWYATEVQKQFDQGASNVTPVDLRMSIMKPLGAKWLVSLYDYFKINNVIVVNGFKAAGIIL